MYTFVFIQVETKSNKKDEDEPPKMEEIDPDMQEGESSNGGGGSGLTTQAIEDIRKFCPELAAEMEQELKNDVAIEDDVCDKCKKKPERYRTGS